MTCLLNPLDLFCSLTGLCESEADQAQKAPRPEDDSPPDASRVRIFEGLTRERLGKMLEGHAIGEEDLNSLAMAFQLEPEGNPDRIDPGSETLRLAEELATLDAYDWLGTGPLFFAIRRRDLEAYKKQIALATWKEKPDAVRIELGLDNVDHPFAAGTQNLEVADLHDFRGLVTFDRLAQTVLEELPQVQKNRELHILYPASGSHVAPLMTAFRLIDSGVIDKAIYTYTEIDEKVYGRLGQTLNSLVQHGLLDSLTIGGPRLFGSSGSEGKEMTFDLAYKGKSIQIVLALNRSGSDYYRTESLHNADAVVIHDPGNNSLKLSYELAGGMLFKKSRLTAEARDKPQLVVLEGEQDPEYFIISMERMVTLPQGIKPIVLPGPYGHCDGIDGLGEITHCEFQSAHVLRLHHPVLLQLADRASSSSKLAARLYREVDTGVGIAIPPDLNE